jgi:hypothetical protein
MYTQDELDALVEEKLAAAKAEGDTAFKKLWAEAKAAKARLKAFDGLDPEDLRDKLTRLEELEQQTKAHGAGVSSKELERLRQEVAKDMEAKYSPFRSKAEELAAENRQLKLDNVVKAQMARHGVRGDRVDALFRLTRDEWDLTDDGQPMLSSHPAMEVDKYITGSLFQEYPEFFEGSGSSGGGASKSAGGAGGSGRVIAASDGTAFLSNLADVAAGKTAVR